MNIDVIVIAGISGSGKSTLAKMLATTLSSEFIEADDYHDEAAISKMRSGIPLSDTDRTPWLLRLHQKLQQCSQPANGHKTTCVIACSALKERYRNLLVGNLNACFVWLNISQELARQRMVSRAGHFMPSSLVQSQLDIAELPANALILDTAQAPEELLSKTLAYIEVTEELNPDRLTAEAERLQSIQNTLDSMPAEYRRLLLMHRFDGLSYDEIARREGLPEAVVQKSITEALAHCLHELQEQNI